MSAAFRVGIVALLHESNTFLRTPTTLESFEQELLLRGDDVRQLEGSHHEVGGFFAGLREAAIDAVPILAARAIPSGMLTATAFSQLLDTLGAELDRAGRLDGLLVAPHGATVCESELDADGFWLGLLRERFGTEFPIIGTLDPHANLSPRMIEATDALIAYRTNPHLDQRQRGMEAAAMMAHTIRGEHRPTQAAAFPPLIINIERQRTSEPHLVEQYAFADAMRENSKVLSNSLILGFPYADVAEMGSSAIVVTDGDRDLARRMADQWADLLWSRRERFVGRLIGIDEALQFVEREEGPICLLDMGDNVGGGSPGDGTVLANAVHQRRIGPSFVCLCDPESAAQISSLRPGDATRLAVGGRTDDLHGPPLEAAFTIQATFPGRFEEPEVRHGGFRSFDMGPTVIVRTETGLTVMLTSKRVPPFSLGQLTAAGLDPASFRVLVAKGVHAPVAAYAPVCRHLVRVNTPGVTTADLSRLTFGRRRRPMFPFEPDAAWDSSQAREFES